MGTGHSKSAPDEQMRMKMESGFDDDDDDSEALGLSERDRNIRSKSNLSFHKSERTQNTDSDEYFNKIYNKRAEKSMSSLSSGGGSIGVKSAPAGTKKEKDPEVAAAIAELEETFKVLGDSAVTTGKSVSEEAKESNITVNHENMDNGNGDSFSTEEYSSSSPSQMDSTRELGNNSDESGVDSQSETSDHSQIHHYDRHLITRAGESSSNGVRLDQNGFPVRTGKFLELNSRIIGTSGGYSNITYSSSGSTHTSRGSDQRNLLISSHSNLKNGRNSGGNLPQSILMQQRKDFQRKQATDGNLRSNASSMATGETGDTMLSQKDWTYEPPKIDGFDIEKFKKINSKIGTGTIVPIILRDEEDKGYYSRSPEIPAYTKDELDLIASLEREVY